MPRFTIEQAKDAVARASKETLPQLTTNATDALPNDSDAIRVAHFRRLAEIRGTGSSDFEEAVWATIEVFRAKQGRNDNRASLNVQHVEYQIATHGAEKAIAKLVAGSVTSGFDFLMARGLADIAAEALVVRFADRFPPELAQKARIWLATE